MQSNDLTRRKFLTGVAVAAAAVRNAELGVQPARRTDHRHAYSLVRSGATARRSLLGAEDDAGGLPRLRIRSLSKARQPLGIVGAIKVEASPWIEDNLWVLEVAQRDTIIVGVIGNLEPDKPEFARVSRTLSRRIRSFAASATATCGDATSPARPKTRRSSTA